MNPPEINAPAGPAGNAEYPRTRPAPPRTPHALLHDTITEWFPLLPRTRPPAQALHQRIGELRQHAQSPFQGSLQTRLSSATEVLNKTALIASDCGLPDLAQQLC